MIVFDKVSRAYGASVILKDISFEIKQGEFVTIFGPNGCGKSTLMNILSGLDKNAFGDIRFDGDIKNNIGFVFQDYRRTLMPWLTVSENILLPLEIRNVPKEEQRKRLDTLLDKVRIDFGLSQRIFTLSGGQAQMVSLLRALIIDPKLLILDEPFSALDYGRTLELRQTVMHVAQTFNLTTIFISHDLDEALYLGDRVVFLTKKPTSVSNILDVPFLGPRTIDLLGSPEFAKLKMQALDIFMRSQ